MQNLNEAAELAIRQRLKDDFLHYAEKVLQIRTKAGDIKPLALNKAQLYIHERLEKQRAETGRVRALILKGRQQGCSTYVEARYYWRVTHRKGVRAFILTHEAESTAALFEMAQRYHEQCNEVVKPSTGASSQKELAFDKLDSAYKVGTAGNKSVGRGTTVQYFHGSEVAFWPHAAEHSKGILQAVPDENETEVILESTANGVGNFYHEQWQAAEAGETDFQAIFVPWYWQDEYRVKVDADFEASDYELHLREVYKLDDGQIAWRRRKIRELTVGGTDGEQAFRQEYPLTAAEAFAVSGDDTLIQPESVAKARIRKVLASGPLIIGVDPARYGDDATAIIRRRGRAAYKLETHRKRSTMEVAGMVRTIIENEKPDQVAIDVGGLGAGVVDRLLELGYEDVVIPINFGSAALDPNRYINRRAEMWYSLKAWLDGDLPVMVPNDDTLHSDLSAVRYIYDSSSRRKLESKEAMRKRGIRSPDLGDALALTFAEPVRNHLKQAKYQNLVNVPPVADAVAGY